MNIHDVLVVGIHITAAAHRKRNDYIIILNIQQWALFACKLQSVKVTHKNDGLIVNSQLDVSYDFYKIHVIFDWL